MLVKGATGEMSLSRSKLENIFTTDLIPQYWEGTQLRLPQD